MACSCFEGVTRRDQDIRRFCAITDRAVRDYRMYEFHLSLNVNLLPKRLLIQEASPRGPSRLMLVHGQIDDDIM